MIDVLVVGGGAIGMCTAYYLHRSGREVALLDKGDPGSGCSYGNAGLLCPSHSMPLAAPGVLGQGLRWLLRPDSPFYIKPRLNADLISWLWRFRGACNPAHVTHAMPLLRELHLRSLDLYRELADLPGVTFGFEQRGRLMLFRTREGLQAGLEETQRVRDLGMPAEELDAAGLQALEPDLRIEVEGAVYYRGDAHLDPHRFVCSLADHLTTEGVAVHPSTEVTGFEVTGNRITHVHTNRGDFSAREVVLAAGSWSAHLAKSLGFGLPIQPAKGYSVTFERPECSPRIPLMLVEAKSAITPMEGTLRVAGTLEMAGLDTSISRRRVETILKSIPGYLPDLRPEQLNHIETWCGLRPLSPDGLPFLGRSPRHANLVIAAGHCTIGMSLAPISGRLVAQVLDGGATELDLHPFRVGR